MALTILAQITAAPGKEQIVHDALHKLVAPTRAEAGCLQYDLHRDNDAPGFFVFYETWESRSLWQAHMNAPHLAEYSRATDGAVTNFVLNELTKID